MIPNPSAQIVSSSGPGHDKVDRIRILFDYNQKQAFLELSVVIAGREKEPGPDSYLKDLEEFQSALQSVIENRTFRF